MKTRLTNSEVAYVLQAKKKREETFLQQSGKLGESEDKGVSPFFIFIQIR
jgi:hypothetical protein